MALDVTVTSDNTNNDNNHDSFSTPLALRRYRSVRDYHAAYVANVTTPIAALDRLLDFLADTNETLRFVQEINVNEARQAAWAATARYQQLQQQQPHQSSSPKSIWDGVPVMIKSEIAVGGFTLTSGRPWKAGQYIRLEEEDILVRRLREAGAIIVATTILHEQGVQPTGYNPHYGGPRNPYDTRRFPGGSSSGSAVAVATGAVPVAIGFDGGGSIRIPASWSGTVGLAVGYGRMPWSGPKINLVSVSKAGPLAATVQDAADTLLLLGQPVSVDEGRNRHVYHVKYGGDGVPPPHLTPRWTSDMESVPHCDKNGSPNDRPVVKIGVFRDWVSHRPVGTAKGADDSVYERFQQTLDRLTSQTAGVKYEIVEFTIPYMREQALSHGLIITSIFSLIMSKELFKGSSRREANDGTMYQPATEIQIKLGQQISALELLACMRIRSFAIAQWRAVMAERAHVILTPTTPMTALMRPAGSDVLGFSDTALFLQMMRYIWPGNLAGLPGLAVPVGVDSVGLPVSVQVICTHWHEADCLAVGADIERAFAKDRPTPSLFFDPLEGL